MLGRTYPFSTKLVGFFLISTSKFFAMITFLSITQNNIKYFKLTHPILVRVLISFITRNEMQEEQSHHIKSKNWDIGTVHV